MRSPPSSITRFGRRSRTLWRYSSYSASVSHFFACTSSPSSRSAATTESSVLRGLHDARRTLAPASRRARARTPVFASTWRAIPIRRPRNAFAFTRSLRIAARTAMWVRAHWSRSRPRSSRSDTAPPMRGGLHLVSRLRLPRDPLPALPHTEERRHPRDDEDHGNRVEGGCHRHVPLGARGHLDARRPPLVHVPRLAHRGGDLEARRDRDVRGERRLELPGRVRLARRGAEGGGEAVRGRGERDVRARDRGPGGRVVHRDPDVRAVPGGHR